MKHLLQRLKAISPSIEEIIRQSGTAGLSLGILHHNEIVFTANYGNKNIETEGRPDENTVFRVASLTKLFTSTAIGILVEDGKLRWDTPLSEILPKFQHCDPDIRKRATVADFLSHRSGIATEDAMWYGDHNRPRIQIEDFVKTTASLKPFFPLGSTFMYSNRGYGLADQIIEKISGEDWGTFLKERLLLPLGLNRTFADVHVQTDNIAEAYVYSGTSDPYHVDQPKFGTGTSMTGACGIKSCVADLLDFYKVFMSAAEDQAQRDPDSMSSPHKSYALGLYHLQLPGDLSAAISDNGGLVKNYPVIGENMKEPPLIMFHASALLGFLGATIIIPESKSAIVVLANTLGLQDAPNWVSGLLLETLLDVPVKNDYVELAKEAAKAGDALFPEMFRDLADKRVPGTDMKSRGSYVGKYYNSAGTWYFDIFAEEDENGECLWLSFCGDREEKYKLEHYNYDVLSWALPYDQMLQHQLWPIADVGYYLLRFESSKDSDLLDRIVWHCYWGPPSGDTYERREA